MIDETEVRPGRPWSAVDCTVPTHPNLCTLHKDTANVVNGYHVSTGTLARMCRLKECELLADPNPELASFARLRLSFPTSEGVDGEPAFPAALSGSLEFKICEPVDVPRIGAELGGDFRLIAAGATVSLNPSFPSSTSTVVCYETHHAEGYCDCTPSGAGLPFEYTLCGDHIDGSGLSCPGAAPPAPRAQAEKCFCTSTPPGCGNILALSPCLPDLTSPCTSDADCGGSRCGSNDQGGRCHGGTTNVIDLDMTGSSDNGDCYIQQVLTVRSFQASGIGSGICTSGETEHCNPAAPASCTTCEPLVGTDGLPCTTDDLVPNSATVIVPLTTGFASGSMEDAVYVEGTCSGSGSPCIQDANCPKGTCDVGGDPCNVTGDCPATQSCIGGETCTGGSIDRVDPGGGVSGAPVSCDSLRGADLSDAGGVAPVRLAARVPFADQRASADGTMTWFLLCD